MFDKRNEVFPVKDEYIFLSHCGFSPLYGGALRKVLDLAELQYRRPSLVPEQYDAVLQGLRVAAARLLGTSPGNLAFVKNTSEGINLIAGGYPFRPGDQIIGYTNEYPANLYPWQLQKRRGVELVPLHNDDVGGVVPEGHPGGWSMDEIEQIVSPRTRVIALSHVQFASGFGFDLGRLGGFCRDRGIDLVIDVAQSLGCLPIYPEEHHVAAMVSSGWKWLMGPIGTGLMYTSEEFREKLEPVLVGAESMRQGTDYLNHTWDPWPTAKRFEYSTSPLALAAALECCLTDLPLRYGVESIAREIFRLQDVFLAALDRSSYKVLLFPEEHRSPILSLRGREDSKVLASLLKAKNVICTERGGLLRFAPHFYNTEEEMERVASLLNALGA